MRFFLDLGKLGGGNIGSMAILRTLSISPGRSLDIIGAAIVRLGFVFISMSQVLKESSIMKSKPKS
jgi:hypothetical protein